MMMMMMILIARRASSSSSKSLEIEEYFYPFCPKRYAKIAKRRELVSGNTPHAKYIRIGEKKRERESISNSETPNNTLRLFLLMLLYYYYYCYYYVALERF